MGRRRPGSSDENRPIFSALGPRLAIHRAWSRHDLDGEFVTAGLREMSSHRRAHETEIEELFDDMLGLCQEAGWCRSG